MGFSAYTSKQALIRFNNDLNLAMNFLLEGGGAD
jgi:uncharacterized UBP type Zn finger protein